MQGDARGCIRRLEQVMNQRQLASVLFAVLGIFMAFGRLPDLILHAAIVMHPDPALVDSTASVSPRAISVFAIIAILVVVAVSVGLIALRDRLARRLFAPAPVLAATAEFQAVAFSVLGVFFVLNSIPRIGWPGGVGLASVVQALLGIGLFLGAHSLAAIWARLRPPGPARHE
jgi:hypothetical protein